MYDSEGNPTQRAGIGPVTDWNARNKRPSTSAPVSAKTILDSIREIKPGQTSCANGPSVRLYFNQLDPLIVTTKSLVEYLCSIGLTDYTVWHHQEEDIFYFTRKSNTNEKVD